MTLINLPYSPSRYLLFSLKPKYFLENKFSNTLNLYSFNVSNQSYTLVRHVLMFIAPTDNYKRRQMHVGWADSRINL